MASVDATEETGEDEFESQGEVITVADLTLPKARSLAEFAQADNDFVSLVACLREESNEQVVLRIQAEVPQHPAHDIRHREEIVVDFDNDDQREPRVTSRRRSFPRVIHTNIGLKSEPVSICLTDIPYEEQRLRWTAAWFVQRLHWWLSKTARGELHDPNQPLEQLFVGSKNRLILPSAFFNADDYDKLLVVDRVAVTDSEVILRAREPDETQANNGLPSLVVVSYLTFPRTHGVIDIQPFSLDDLVGYLGDEGERFLDCLSDKLKQIRSNSPSSLDAPVAIVLQVPRRRSDESAVEKTDVWAFATTQSASKVGGAIGAWGDSQDTMGGLLLERDRSRNGEGIAIDIMLPTASLTQQDGATYNLSKFDDKKCVAVGVGALGSQVVEHLARMGFGKWTIIDDDILLPHNAARHYLSGHGVGHSKAKVLSAELNLLYEDEIANPIVARMGRDTSDELDSAFDEAALVVDLSASLSVARQLAIDTTSNARRVSAFLSPTGADSVLIAEPTDRSKRLDLLEMDYYRAVIQDERLKGHLKVQPDKLHYANACRDASLLLEHDCVVAHSAVIGRGIRNLDDAAIVKVWRADDSLIVSPIMIAPDDYRELSVGDWTLLVSASLIGQMAELRNKQLPSETGGVLVGSIDASRRLIYVVDHIAAPPDSEGSPNAFIRGCEGLKEKVDSIRIKTAGQIDYIGEWHSHPGDSTAASEDDRVLFAWLKENRQLDGLPALMAICAGKTSRWFVADIDQNGELAHE